MTTTMRIDKIHKRWMEWRCDRTEDEKVKAKLRLEWIEKHCRRKINEAKKLDHTIKSVYLQDTPGYQQALLEYMLWKTEVGRLMDIIGA